MPSHELLIPLPDYERIFRTIFTVLEGVRIAQTERACIFFSLVGAALLETSYGLDARPIGGAAAFGLGISDARVLTFGRMRGDDLVAEENAFHCWVECDGFAIDFMAPIFERSLRSAGNAWSVPPRMFQKPLGSMAPDVVSCAEAPGSFLLEPDRSTTLRLLKSIAPQTAESDLANICLQWHKRPPRKMVEVFTIGDSQGEPIELKLNGPRLVGVW